MHLSKAGQPVYKPDDRFINRRPVYKPVKFSIGSQHIYSHNCKLSYQPPTTQKHSQSQQYHSGIKNLGGAMCEVKVETAIGQNSWSIS